MRAAARIIRISDMQERIQKLRDQGIGFVDTSRRINALDRHLATLDLREDDYWFEYRLKSIETRISSLEWTLLR